MDALTIDALMRRAPVIPVLVIDDVASARTIARQLVEAGLPVIEVTLRTAAALDVIEEMAQVDGAIVGAGTVLNARDLHAAAAAGARFAVSPGLTDALAQAANALGMPLLPGVASASDLMRGLDLGFERFKLFPAVAAGGLPLLRALAGPFGHVRFCPTGGITATTASAWLAEESVLCVGGSWVVRDGCVDLDAISTFRNTVYQAD